MNRMKVYVVSILFLAFGLSFAAEEDKTLLLQIGDKTLKNKVMTISAGKIFSAEKGGSIPFALMIQEMAKSRLVYVGETHNSLSMHQIQSRIIQALYEQDRNLSVGLEMYPVTSQEVLNRWSLGILSEDEFIREGLWYVTWNFNFGFYEEIFKFTKEKSIPLFALNVPREVISKVRMKGWEALSAEEKQMTPEPDLTNEDHRTLIRTIFESSEIPHQMKGAGLEMAFEGLYRAQTTWDETMAFYALQGLEKEEGRMVVLAGSGHLIYNLGINLRAYEESRLPFKTVVCVAIPKDKESIEVSRSLADYVWGLPEEERPAFPSVGLSFKKFDGLENLVIERKPFDGVSEAADFEKGDVVLAVEGQEFKEINELRIFLAKFGWGDQVKFRLLRNAEEKEVLLKFEMADVEKQKQ
jgi:uncharacterized iron-regulated protein